MSAPAIRLTEAQLERQGGPLVLLGHCPSKKNLWRPRKHGRGIYLDAEASAQVNSLVLQAKVQANKLGLRYLESPNMRITFHVRTRRADRDNKLSCLLDVLQEAEVLFNDNTRWFNGVVTLMPAVVSKDEKTVVEIL